MKPLFVSLFLIVGCTKSGNDPVVPTAELLVNVKWKLSAVSGKLSNGTVIPDDYSGLPSYKKDDYYFFKSDFTFTYNDNIDKRPGASSTILEDGTWQLSNGDKDLQMSGSGASYFPTKIISISSKELIIESYDSSSGSTIQVTYTKIP